MKRKNLVFLLALVAIAFAIPSFGQTTYRTVPDSLTCITPAQDVFYMTQSFTIKGLQTSIVLKDKENANLKAALVEKEGEITQAHLQEKLANDNNKNSQADLTVEKEKVSKLTNKGKVQKVLLWITGPIAIIETGAIALSQYMKRLP